MQQNYDTIIIGGGVSGMTAAIMLGRKQQKVLLIEQCKELGKKIYATGNGRCNFTNSHYDADSYRGEQPAFAKAVYDQFPYTDTIQFMHSIGVLEQQKDGYFYPYTNQAKTVVQAMIAAIPKRYVTLCLDRIVRNVKKTKNGFHIITSYGEFYSKRVIFATGGQAGVVFKKEPYAAYDLAEALGHSVTALSPALCALYSRDDCVKQWKGIRAHCKMQLYEDPAGQKKISPAVQGEIQLTDYGISGIPVFQLSRYAGRYVPQKNVYAQIDFLEEYSNAELWNMKTQLCAAGEITVLQYLCGYFSDILAKIFLQSAAIAGDRFLASLSRKEWDRVWELAKHWKICIYKTADYAKAQVTAGGVRTAELQADTMQSRLVENLYFIGEITDVDGTCGGYNIQYAISSAAVCAKAILKDAGKDRI